MQQKWQINYDKPIGKGQYGIVYECYAEGVTSPICAKVVSIGQPQKQEKILNRELEILEKIKGVDNPNLIKIYDLVNTETELQIFMEKCANGDLKGYLERTNQLRASEILAYLSQIVSGYKTLNDNKIIHRDLKPANILVGEDGQLKLTDFGMGKIIDDLSKKKPHTKVGTPAYAAPQLYLDPDYSSQCDVYSLGIVVYQMTFKRLPFCARTINELVCFLRDLKTNPLKCPAMHNIEGTEKEKNEIRELIEKMTLYDENSRMSWKELFARFPRPREFKNSLIQSDKQLFDSFLSQKRVKTTPFSYSEFIRVTGLAPGSEIKRSDKIYHFIRVMLARYELANETQMLLENVIPKKIPYLDENYYLILIAIQGYKFKVVCNIYGFCYAVPEMICKDFRQILDMDVLVKALLDFAKENEKHIKKIQEQAEVLKNVEGEKFQDHQNILLQNPSYKRQDLEILIKLVGVGENTEFLIYHSWFCFFYKKYLKSTLSKFQYQKEDDVEFLRLILAIEKFSDVEKLFPVRAYTNQNPDDIAITKGLNKNELISEIKKFVPN